MMSNVGYSYYYLQNHSKWDNAPPCGSPSSRSRWMHSLTLDCDRSALHTPSIYSYIYINPSTHTPVYPLSIYILPSTVHTCTRTLKDVRYVFSRPACGCVSEWKEHAERVGVTTIIICPIHKGYYEYLHVFERGSLWREWRLYSDACDGGL